MSTIHLVEDDATIADLVTALLEGDGHVVWWSSTGGEGIQQMQQAEQPDLMILDVRLPDIDGLTVCAEVRRTSRLPILMLSARGEDLDKIAGMEAGADDYLAKPFNPGELLARVRALLRRWTRWQEPAAPAREAAVVTRHACVLFADIWNYNALSNKMSLDAFADQVSEYFEKVEAVVLQHKGVLNNNWGESVVAVFDDILPAARAAQGIQREVDTLNRQWLAGGKLPFGVGVGLHCGEMVMGDVSLRGKAEFALVGRQAKKAASIEKMSRGLGAKILLSQDAATALGDAFPIKNRGIIRLEGEDISAELFELAVDAPENKA